MTVNRNIYALLVAFFLLGCVSPPENFPSTPEINFEDLRFVELDNASDSLIVSVRFQDAEGNLGLNAEDINPPYNPLDYQRDNSGQLITYSNRPSEAPNYNPIDWEINPIVNNTQINDTIWVKQNPNFNNIFVRFYIKRDGEFSEFDWSAPPFYTTFNGRFPTILSDNNERAIEGTIQYSMLSSGWRAIFRNDTIRVDIQIQDRTLNKSNVVSSPEVTLNQISK